MSQANQHIAMISGGAGDIGRAIALELARRGADVALGDVADSDERVDALKEEIEQVGRRFRFDSADVTDPVAVDQWFQSVEKSLGVADWIVPNAAVATRASFDTLTPETWRRCLDVNLNGAYYFASRGAERLVEHGSPGRIVFIGSWAAHVPHDFIAAYSVSKAGLRMLMQTMALHYADKGILVNEVAPGYVDAGLSKVGFDKDPESRRRCAAQAPVGELMSAEEVAFHVAHLCDERNRSMVGTVLLADGGLSLTARQ